MSALATRMLVLGVVRIFEPANAYQLRRELLSWGVEQWANLNPGSIYGMLTSLEKAGAVARHDLVGVNGRPVAVYTTTSAGAAEFPRLLDAGLREITDWADAVDLRAALSLMPYLTRDGALEALRARIGRLDDAVAELQAKTDQLRTTSAAPPHVVEELDLELTLARAQVEWLRGYAARIEAGELFFADEGRGWMPPEDDPGFTMQRDRDLYRRQIEAVDSIVVSIE